MVLLFHSLNISILLCDLACLSQHNCRLCSSTAPNKRNIHVRLSLGTHLVVPLPLLLPLPFGDLFLVLDCFLNLPPPPDWSSLLRALNSSVTPSTTSIACFVTFFSSWVLICWAVHVHHHSHPSCRTFSMLSHVTGSCWPHAIQYKSCSSRLASVPD